jgi:hypothetical protein
MTFSHAKRLQNERRALAAANASVATPTFSAASSVMPQTANHEEGFRQSLMNRMSKGFVTGHGFSHAEKTAE